MVKKRLINKNKKIFIKNFDMLKKCCILLQLMPKTPVKKKKATTTKTAAKKATPKKVVAKKAPTKKVAPKASAKKTTTPKKTTPKKGGSIKKELRTKLLSEKKRLLAEVSEKIKSESAAGKFDIGDIYDLASNERERELTLTLGDRERARLLEIDDALERLSHKDYGLCEDCGDPIGNERLRALPFTRVCVDCKTRLEKDNMMRGLPLENSQMRISDKIDASDDEY